MKKEPAKKYEKTTGSKAIVATMAEESRLRESEWIKRGCNSFDSKRAISKPMSFWTEQDVLEYIYTKKLKIASVYGDIQQDTKGKYYTTGCNRTGCMFCMFGIKSEKSPNRFQRMYYTHPALYDYCLNKLGIKDVLEFIDVPYKPEFDLFNQERDFR